MEASKIYENILNQTQISFLNYKIEFSAVISLKKSFVKDRSGNTLHPLSCETDPLHLSQPAVNLNLLNQNANLQKQVESLKSDYINVLDECETDTKLKADLESRLTVKSEEKFAMKDALEKELSDLQTHLEKLEKEKGKCKVEFYSMTNKHEKTGQNINVQKSENENLQRTTNSLSTALKSLKKELNDTIKMKDEETRKLASKMEELMKFKVNKDK